MPKATYSRFLPTLLLIVLLILLGALQADSASGQDVIQAPLGQNIMIDPTDPPVYGANAVLEIEFGFYAFVDGCSGGIEDGGGGGLFAATDVYLIPSSSLPEGGPPADGDSLTDVSGSPNTFDGIDLTIRNGQVGITEPSGSVGPGTYAVIYDECQNGVFDAGQDAVFGPVVYTVEVSGDVPPLPSIAAMKAEAAEQARRWNLAVTSYALFDEAKDLYDKVGEAIDVISAIRDGTIIIYLAKRQIPSPPGSLGITIGFFESRILPIMLATAGHYQGIAADPPDPNFQQLNPLGRRAILQPLRSDSSIVAAAKLGTVLSSEEKLLQAFLTSLERYQGAQEAGNAEWALVHARATQRYANLLNDLLPETSASLGDFASAVEADPSPLEETATELEAFRSRVESSGFSQEEVQTARDLGLSGTAINQLREELLSVDSYSFTREDLLSANQDLQEGIPTLTSTFSDLAADLDPIIQTLEEQVDVAIPVAAAGGPHAIEEGISVSFDGSGSAGSISSYEWDLDGDGDFDDATGAAPSYAYNQAFRGLVGLRVTNADGRSSIDYALIEVTNVNSAPTFSAFSPENTALPLITETPQPFSVEASDPDGDPFEVTWHVDSVGVASGPTFTYEPTGVDVGVHLIEAVAQDASPLGGKRRISWFVGVTTPPDSLGEPDIAVSGDVEDDVLDFGSVAVDNSAQQTVLITNEGEADLAVTNLQISGDATGDFALEEPPPLPATVTAGDSLSFAVAFTPLAVGARMATLAIESNDPDESPLQVALRGSGAQEMADTTPPVCGEINVEGNAEGLLSAIQTSATDEESGIASVAFTTLQNLDGFLNDDGPFAEGDTESFPEGTETVEIRGERIDFAQGGAILTTITNGAGLSRQCDPVVEQITAELPKRFALEGNAPNPFRSQTKIAFSLAETAQVRLEVFDLLGRKVATLVNEELTPSHYEMTWDGRGESGQMLAPGVYLYRIEAGSFRETRRMTLVR